MGMTMTQKILAAHAGLDSVEAGQLIEAKLDVVMANDITGPMALPIIKQMSDHVFDKDKVVFVPDHFTPNKDIKSAENSKAIREYAKEQGLTWYFEQGTEPSAHSPQEWGRQTWRRAWRPARSGSRCPARSSSS